MKCPTCGFTHDRDAIGAINLVKRYFIDVGPVPLGSTATHDPIVVRRPLWAR